MEKVLIVEDEALVRQGIILSVDWAALDCMVVGEASNGEEALELAEQYAPSLILSDIRMPKMDGLEFLRRLRAKGNTASVIFITAHDSFEYARTALRLGASDYLLKPLQAGELEQAIRNLQQPGAVCTAADPLQDLKKGDRSHYVLEAMYYIGAHFSDADMTVRTVAEALGISEGYLSHVFKKETNYTLLNYLTRYRVQKAMDLLNDYKKKVYEVAELVGYRDTTYFSTTFKKFVGLSPSEYQLSRR